MSNKLLREALQALYAETADYIKINNLGDPHQNRSMQLARDALAQPAKVMSDEEINTLANKHRTYDDEDRVYGFSFTGLQRFVRALLAVQDDAPVQPAHTMEQDFQHFLTIKGWSNANISIVAIAREAFEAAWGPAPVQAAMDEEKVSGQVYGIIDPEYGRIYTMIRKLAWEEGYAIGMHGSFTRDLDLIAVPWAETVREPEHFIRRVVAATKLNNLHNNPGVKPHGRLVWTLTLPEFGDPRFVDLSIMPVPVQADTARQECDARDAILFRFLVTQARLVDFDGGNSGIYEIRGIPAYDNYAKNKFNRGGFRSAVAAAAIAAKDKT